MGATSVASPPPVRTGTCRWSVWIAPAGASGGSRYSVRPMPDQPGFRGVFQLRKHGAETTYTVAAPKSGDPGCTCPDHEARGACCKHILALAAPGLVKRPRVARPKKAPSLARVRRAHAKHAHAAIAEAQEMLEKAQREVAALGPAPGASPIAPPPRPIEELMPAPTPGAAILYPVAPAPAAAASFAAGFRQAVATHLKLKRGELLECELCGYPFDPTAEGTTHPALCGPCTEGGAS